MFSLLIFLNEIYNDLYMFTIKNWVENKYYKFKLIKHNVFKYHTATCI